MTGGSPPPVVRLFVSCAAVRCDIHVQPNRYTIDDPFFAIRPPAGANYPFRASELWLFCQFSDVTGRQPFQIDLSWDVDTRVQQIHSFNVDFGTDRLAVRNYAIRLMKVPFRRAGIYGFRLRQGMSVLARSTVRLEEAT